MTYFILWAVFLVTVILLVPITAFLEKRKRLAATGPIESASDDQPELEDELPEEAVAESESVEVDELPDEDELAEFEEVR